MRVGESHPARERGEGGVRGREPEGQWKSGQKERVRVAERRRNAASVRTGGREQAIGRARLAVASWRVADWHLRSVWFRLADDPAGFLVLFGDVSSEI